MFLGFDDSLKGLKKEWKDAGVDMSLVRTWQKSYDKVRVQRGVLQAAYERAKRELLEVQELLEGLEQQLIQKTYTGDGLQNTVHRMKGYLGHFDHEFLLGKADTDFQTTYDSIMRLCLRKDLDKGDAVILQSETENILAIIKEALDRKWPDFRALSFFYLEHTDKDLVDMPHQEKLILVRDVYQQEFLMPMENALRDGIDADRVRHLMEEDIWNL